MELYRLYFQEKIFAAAQQPPSSAQLTRPEIALPGEEAMISIRPNYRQTNLNKKKEKENSYRLLDALLRRVVKRLPRRSGRKNQVFIRADIEDTYPSRLFSEKRQSCYLTSRNAGSQSAAHATALAPWPKAKRMLSNTYGCIRNARMSLRPRWDEKAHRRRMETTLF